MANTDQQPEQLAQLPTEARNPRSAHIDELPTLKVLQIINDEDATIAAAVRAALPQIAQAVDAIAARFAHGGRLFYLGAGTSGRLGVLDASECPPTFSVPPGLFVGLIAGGDAALRNSSEHSEDSPQQGAADLAACAPTPSDAVLGIAASGRTPYVLGALTYANTIGALTIALTCAAARSTISGLSLETHPMTPGAPCLNSEAWDGSPPKSISHPSPLAQAAQIAIELATGPEILTGSTRMKAGTATKLVLNMISTAVMIRRGAVLGNLMVDVRPTNEKLVDRAHRIIAAATGCDASTAARLLTDSGSVKTAILMHKRNLAKLDAEQLLAANHGRLAQALRS